MKHGLLRRARGAALILFAALAAGTFLPARPAAADATPPVIGSVASSDTGTGTGLYKKLELVFSVKTSAANLLMPYDPVAPAYVANLRPTEDARNGVSVDALLLPPGQTDWSKAQTWPCYYQQDFDSTGYPLGTSAWHLRFAPTQVGSWHYELRATDAGGSVTTNPAIFTCVPSTSKGFIRVSPTDSRYFEYSDGTPFIAAGLNVYVPTGAPSEYTPQVQAFASSGATSLLRVWLSTFGGIGVIGGFADLRLSKVWGYNSDQNNIVITPEDAHTGRYSLRIPSGTGGIQASVPLLPNVAYTFSAWVKAVGTDPGATFMFSSFQPGATRSWALASGWQQVTGTIPATTQPATQGSFTLKLDGSSHGYILLDDVRVLDSGTGADLMGPDGGFEWHTGYSQRYSAALDSLVQLCEQNGQYLKLVCLAKFENAFSLINPDGTAGTNVINPDAVMGGTGNPNDDTAVLRLQRYYARYLMARWGYSTAIHSWEYTNEMDQSHTLQFAGAQSFAKAIHGFTADGRRLVTSSACWNSAGRTYDPTFYENPTLYPDIDYADYHAYAGAISAYGPYLPYDDEGAMYNCRGMARSLTGGPNGLGQITADPKGPTADSNDSHNLINMLPIYRGRGAGSWTIKFWYKTSSDVQFGPTDFYHACGGTVELYNPAPDVVGSYPWSGTPRTPVKTWTECTETFKTVGDGPHNFDLDLYAANVTQGTVSFADVRLYAPDGQVWSRFTFNEPTMDKDSAGLVQYSGLGKESYSGTPAIGKPMVYGEIDMYTLQGTLMPTVMQDTNGAFLRQALWSAAVGTAGVIPIWWRQIGGWFSQNNQWHYQGAVQKFMQGIPLSNGNFRDLGATVSPTLRVVGQKDVQDGLAVFWVQNRGSVGDGSDAANWYNLTVNPTICAPVSGTVAVPGLADGAYQVDMWDTAAGKSVATTTLTTSGGVLTVPLTNMGEALAVKISPAVAPSLDVQLTTDRSVAKPGDLVTYTLNYTNQGKAQALNISLPWSVPDHTQFVTASNGGVYDAAKNMVTWKFAAIAPGAVGTVTLTVRIL